MKTALSLLLESERAAGLALVIATALAVLIANSSLNMQYEAALLWRVGPLDLHDWISEGLMAVFFFNVGQELRHEMKAGILSSFDRAVLPLVGALGGMIVPAMIFLLFVRSGIEIRGVGIPIATDIAFALGALSLLGKRVPFALKVFLLALAVADDLGAIVVIALFYTETIHWPLLILAFVGIGTIAMIRVWRFPLTFVLAVAVWWLFVRSGVHATVAGCILGFLLPASLRYKPVLQGLSQFVIMPTFALANAGLSFEGFHLSTLVATPLVLGVSFGLCIGKPLGIFGASIFAVQSGYAKLDDRISLSRLFGVACLGGIGFTMSLFISSLALPTGEMDFARFGIVFGSVLSAALGFVVLNFALESTGCDVSNKSNYTP